MFISSFIFMPTFPQGRTAGQQPQGSRYLTVNHYLRYFCWLHSKTGSSKVGGTVEFAKFVTSRGLEKSYDFGEMTNSANK